MMLQEMGVSPGESLTRIALGPGRKAFQWPW